MYWNEKPYHSLDYEMKRIYGHKIYKLALDGGMTCPNRDGTLGTEAVSSAAPRAPETSPAQEPAPSQSRLPPESRP